MPGELTPDESIKALEQEVRQRREQQAQALPSTKSTPGTLDLHPIDPIQEPGRWLHTVWRGMADPVNEAWQSESWRIPKTGVAMLGSALNVIPSMITTTLGFEKSPTLWDAATQYADAKQLPKAERLGLQTAGFASDIYLGGPTDPLRFFTFGPKAMAKTAEKILAESTPELANLSNPSQWMRLQKYARSGGELTQDNVSGYVVPKMVQNILENTPAQTTVISKDLDTLRKAHGDYEITDHVFGHKRSDAVQGAGITRSYDQMMAHARSLDLEELRAFATPPEEILKNPKSSLYDRLDAIAKYSAYAEKAIMNDRAATRIHLPIGTSITSALRNLREGIPIAPSPTRAIGKAARGLFGRWVEQTAGRAKLSELESINPYAKQAGEFMSAGGLRLSPFEARAVTDANPLQVEQFLAMYQAPFTMFTREINSRGRATGNVIARGGSNGLIVDSERLLPFIANEIGSMPEHLRMQHLDNIRGTYKFLREVVTKNPNLEIATDKFRLSEACDLLDNIHARLVNNIATSTRGVGNYARMYNLLTQPGIAAHQFRLHNILDETKALAARIQGRVSGQLYQKTGTEAEQLATLLSSPADLPEELTRFFRNFEALNNMTVSYPYALKAKMDLRELHNVANEIHSYYVMNQTAVREQFLAQGTGNMNSLKILGKLLRNTKRPEPGTRGGYDYFDRLKNQLSNPALLQNASSTTIEQADAWSKLPANILNQERANAMSFLQRKMRSMATKGQLTPQEYSQALRFLRSADNKSFAGIIYSLDDLKNTHAQMSLDAALLDRLTQPLHDLSKEVQRLTNTEFKAEFTRLGQALAGYQANYKPRQILAKIMMPGGWMDDINKLQDKVLRRAGFGPVARDTMEKYLEAKEEINPVAENFGKEFSKNVIVKNAIKYSATLAAKMTPAVETELNNLAGNYVQYIYTRARVAEDLRSPNPAIMGKASRHLAIAECFINESLEGLKKIFGSETAARSYAEDVRRGVEQVTEAFYKEEVPLGLGRLHRKGYVPYAVVGDYTDKQVYSKLTSTEELAAGLSPRDKKAISRAFSGEHHRELEDASAVVAYIQDVNAEKIARGEAPLNLQVESHLSAILANRKKMQLQSLNNRQLVDTLEAVLPAQMKIITSNISDKAHSKLRALSGYSDLGELIPSMSGKWINSELFEYLKQYVPPHQRENKCLELLRWVQNTYTRTQIQYSLVHLKNLASLVVIAGTEPGRIFRILKTAMKGQGAHVAEHPGMSNLLKRMALSLEESELYRNAVRNGITHSRMDAVAGGVMENVKNALAPTKINLSTLTSKGPFTTLIFDVMDRAAKMAFYEQLLEQGVPGRQAATWVNYYMIDYTGKNLNPNFRKNATAVMPFVSWNIQNALLHIPEMINNPRRYAMVNYLKNYLPQTVLKNNVRTPSEGSKQAELLADAMITPYKDSKNNNTAVYLDPPWEKYIRLWNNSIKNPTSPGLVTSELIKFIANKTYWAHLIKLAMDPAERRREEIKEKLPIQERMLGNDRHKGLLEETFWGFAPTVKTFRKAVQSVSEDGSWADFTPAILNLVIGRTAQVNPVTGEIQK